MNLRQIRSVMMLGMLLASAVPSAASDCIAPPKGLAAWFRMEGNVKDQLSELKGELPASAAFEQGKVGQGLLLDGTKGVVLPRDMRFERGVFTLELWLRRADVGRASQNPTSHGVVMAGLFGNFSLTMAGDGQLYLSHVGVESFNFGASIKDLEWHHVCMVRNGIRFTLFVDGNPGGEVVRPGVSLAGPLAIGSLAEPFGGESYPFWGSVDEVGVYSRELSPVEIKALAGLGTVGKCWEGVTGSGGPDCVAIPGGLVGWYPLDVDGRNQAPGGAPGGDSATVFGPGFIEGAAFFDGLNPGIVLPDDPRMKVQDFTVEAWIKRASTVASSQASPPDGTFFSGGDRSYGLALKADGAFYLAQIGGGNYVSAARVADTNWHHVAVSKAGGIVTFYLDGANVGVQDLGGLQFDLSTPFAIGSLGVPFGGIHYTFLGSVDDLAFYDRPLSAAEIEVLWGAGSAGKCNGGLRLGFVAPKEVEEGVAFEYTVKVVNQGTNTLSGVRVTNSVPSGFVVGSAVPSTGTAVANPGADGTEVIFTPADLSAGAEASVRVTLTGSVLGKFRLEARAIHATETQAVVAGTEILIRPTCSPAPPGLTAWWRGEGSAQDAIRGGTGSLSNGVSFVEGRIGSAFRFDGQPGSGVNLGPVSAFQRADFSVECWLRRGSSSAVTLNGPAATLLGADTDGWSIALLPNGALSFGRSDVSSVTTGPVITDTAWHHVAVTRSAGEVRFYRDGQLVGTQGYVESFRLAQDYGLGCVFPSGRNPFLGELDEVAFYDRVLSEANIAAIAGAGGAPKCVEDLVLSTDAPGTVALGEEWAIRFQVGGLGSVDSTRVTFMHAVPAGLQLVSVTPSQGTIENLAGILKGDLGTIPAGSNAVVTVVVKPLVAGTYDLVASVTRAEPELSEANNSISFRTTSVALTVGLEGDVTVSEPGVAEFAVTLNAISSRAVSVSYATEAGTATAGADFEAASGVLEFPPGTVRQTLRIPVAADGLYELDESFAVVLSAPVNTALGLARVTANIVSPDPIPTVRVRSVTAPEGNSQSSGFVFEFSLDRPSGLVASLKYASTNDTAKAPTDFAAAEGTVQFAPGETTQSVTVRVNGDTAVEPNEQFFLTLGEPQGLRFGSTPPSPAVGTIVNDDAVAGLVTQFFWDDVVGGVDIGTPFAARLSARDGLGQAVTAFDGAVGIRAFAGPGRPSRVILTEVTIGNGRAVELQNVSPVPVNVGGWKVHLYDSTLWPAPKYVFTIPQDTTVAPGAVFTVSVSTFAGSPGLYPRFGVSGNLRWNVRETQGGRPQALVGVVVTGAEGEAEDAFFAGAADPSAVGVPVVLKDEDWFGGAVADAVPIDTFFRPPGQKRNQRRASDWSSDSFSRGSLGRPNPGLVQPFVDAVPLRVAPDAATGFAGGVWTGSLALQGYAPLVRLEADDGNGHRSLSNPFEVRIADDLTVGMTVTPQLVTAPSWESDFVVAVTNLGPVLSSNVTATVVLSPFYGSAGRAVLGAPQVSQGTVTVRTISPPLTGFQAEITARFGDLPAGAVATLVVKAGRIAVGGLVLPASLESTVSVTRDPMELNLENNAVTVVQELAAVCAPLAAQAAAWWSGDGNPADRLAGLVAVPQGPAAPGLPRVGLGSFAFSGPGSGVRVADAPALNPGPGESFALETWIRIPPASADSLAILSKEEIREEGRTGYAMTVLGGLLGFRISDGTASNAWTFGTVVDQPGDLRDGQWHHVVVSVNRTDSPGATAFVDGVRFGASGQPAMGGLVSPAPLRFGEPAPGAPEQALEGNLDEIVVYRSGLTPLAARAGYEAGANGHCLGEFELVPVSPRFSVEPFRWTALDDGVVGQHYRMDFSLVNRGRVGTPVTFRLSAYTADTNVTLLTVDGPVPVDQERLVAQAFLANGVAPGGSLPFALYVRSTNQEVQLNLLGMGVGDSSKSASTMVRINFEADSDGDGIPDAVETAAGLDPLAAADASSDLDSDGYTAAQEFEAGTQANSASSVLKLRVVEGQVVVDALASRVYRLEKRPALGSGGWTLIQSVRPETDGVLAVGPIGSGADPIYYRVVVEQPYAMRP